jgi:hypothetical protein
MGKALVVAAQDDRHDNVVLKAQTYGSAPGLCKCVHLVSATIAFFG